jgi:uncharacterized membrane-anchored protein
MDQVITVQDVIVWGIAVPIVVRLVWWLVKNAH